MKALCWQGVNELSVERVPDPQILNAQDAIVKVTMTGTCGSDLHLLGGYIPAMRAGDVIGHEFIGEVVDVGSEVRRHRVGDRVVVCSIIGCGRCRHCEDNEWSLCENSNVKPGVTDLVWGGATAGIFGFSHALGGFRGSHAEYVRVPFADQGAFAVPDGVDDVSALFASDAAPTGWMGADLGGVRPGDVVAVWGCGGVGQMAAGAAMLLGAERVIAIDKYPERLAMTERHVGAETIDYSRTDVIAELKERTGGRGPDVCIEAVGLEADSSRPRRLYGEVKQRLGLELDRPFAVREAIYACRTGGSVFILGVFAGLSDRFPLGAMMNKGLTVRGAQQHGHRYIPRLLDLIDRGELRTAHLATHTMSLDQAPKGYDMFKNKKDGCVRAVFRPWA
ncbi:glutathione-dependent formaldehyde dehydrogenase [Sphaerisporangium krabiense]|uniref:Threonine dehydrogenase-like Zn-dependent dehydrogenase n=1 Tax=Sphaerisporangium krabiense TaxID=763782 RepID=A0A7W8ZBC1_9ACTN|nr:zinc-dependent alcohol dehydrogenase [Sphaerisporangium krabiense]MBB5630842.1 threonine dehydrogenase-like Zn-dependent dehydrogenase [Sphaerisporangium krabiense]GII65474.1 glutathione-dependent formaldehyde dehydrogenase [Sphaerisporangium krabiense]